MPRMTRLLPGDTRYSLDPSRVEKEPDGWYGDAVERLAAFENWQEWVMLRVRDIPGELAALRAQGREKSVTARELTAQRMLFLAWLDMARERGLAYQD